MANSKDGSPVASLGMLGCIFSPNQASSEPAGVASTLLIGLML